MNRIETSRLILRTPTENDAKLFANYRMKNREIHAPLEPKRNEDYYTERYWSSVLRDSLKAEGDQYRFAVFEKASGELVGMANLWDVVRHAIQSANLGYSIDHGKVGTGYATEAAKAVVEFGFRTANLHRIEACVLPHNAASIRVLEKCGFRRVGALRQSLKLQSGWADHDLYEILEQDLDQTT